MTIECSNPYPGPESFARGDDRPYFGREQETTDLSSLAVTERLLVFYAPSGAGKTSLLNKRLIPRLEEKLYEVLPTARVSGAASLPANVRNVYAYNLMTRIVRDDPEPERFAGLSLSEFLWHVSTEDGQTYFYDPGDTALRIATAARDLWPRVLILDQFEEVVTSYPGKWQHREEFFRQLDEALGADPMLRVVMSLRSDYVQGLERYAGLLRYGLRARYQMLLMGTGDALKAIEGPAEACGRAFVPGVARQLVKNMSQLLDLDAEGRPFTVEGETVEPIQLQVVCYQLWESMKGTPGDRIEMEDLRRLARAARPEASAALAGVEDENKLLSDFVDDALSAFYERSLAESLAAADAEVEEAFLRNWFSTQLITEGGARGLVIPLLQSQLAHQGEGIGLGHAVQRRQAARRLGQRQCLGPPLRFAACFRSGQLLQGRRFAIGVVRYPLADMARQVTLEAAIDLRRFVTDTVGVGWGGVVGSGGRGHGHHAAVGWKGWKVASGSAKLAHLIGGGVLRMRGHKRKVAEALVHIHRYLKSVAHIRRVRRRSRLLGGRYGT